MYVAQLAPGEWEKLRDRSIWERLARIARGGGVLPQDAVERLRLLERTYPEWRLTGEEQQDFPAWTSARWGYESDYSAPALLALPDPDLIAVLKDHSHNREGLLQTWREAARQQPKRAMTVLGTLLEHAYFDDRVWSITVRGIAETMADLEQATRSCLDHESARSSGRACRGRPRGFAPGECP